MTRRKKPAPEGIVVDADARLRDVGMDERDLKMFQRWMGGSTKAQIAKEFAMNPVNVSKIATKNKWTALRDRIRERLYAESCDSMKDLVVQLSNLAKTDVVLLAKSTAGKKRARLMTKDERMYVHKMLDLFMNQVRLHEGKPTASLGGEIKIVYEIPPGQKPDWVIPPSGGNAKMVQAEVTDAQLSEEDVERAMTKVTDG